MMRFWTIVATIAAAVVLGQAPHPPPSPCSGVEINAGDDLDAVVNADPADRATTFCVRTGTYHLSEEINIHSGDKLIGEPGQVLTRGPASYGVPTVRILNGASLARIVRLDGSNIELKWLDISGAVGKYNADGSVANGSGVGIGAGEADATLLMEYLAIHDHESNGVSSMNGTLLHSDLYNNGTNPDFWGFSAAAVKGVDEYEAAYNFVHDNPANGLWCDHRCSDAGAAMPNGAWFHDNVIVNNGRWGVRYEYSPIAAPGDPPSSQPTFLAEENIVAANGYEGTSWGGASMQDAQNGAFRNNFFGPITLGGVTYARNNNEAIQFSDSPARTDLWNGEAVGNALGGETIAGCEKPDGVVYCANNR